MRNPAAWVAGLVLLLTAVSAVTAAGPPTAPDPTLDPAETVQAMLAAMRKNSDAGIEELWRFSSPGNKQQTGPVSRFKQMMHDGFPDMLGLKTAKLAPALVDGPKAMIGVEILGSDDETHRYVFLLSLQKGAECDGCWMADAVFSPDQEEDESPGQRRDSPT